MSYKGSWGSLRASMSHLDAQVSTDKIPDYTFDQIEKTSTKRNRGNGYCVGICGTKL